MNADYSTAKILVAGADFVSTAARALVIEFAGYHCETAGSVEEVETRLREECFGLVVTDPSLRGSIQEIMGVLKRNSPHAVVLLLTENGKAVVSGDSDVLICAASDFLHSLGAV